MVPLTFGEGHLERIGGEGGVEDVSGDELSKDIRTSGCNRHKTTNDIVPLSLGKLSGLLSGPDVFAFCGIVVAHPGSFRTAAARSAFSAET